MSTPDELIMRGRFEVGLNFKPGVLYLSPNLLCAEVKAIKAKEANRLSKPIKKKARSVVGSKIWRTE